MSIENKQQFLQTELKDLLQNLKPDTSANFGLMTSQHMVEHLSQVIKSSVKQQAEPENPPTDRQLGFKRFIAKGSVLTHRPSTKTAADLPPLFYPSLEIAKEQLMVGINRFYAFFAENPAAIPYTPLMGKLSFEELELFHYQHVRYHLWQFGVLASYPE